MTVLQGISNFEGTSYKKLQDKATSSFISCCLTSIFTSADITFYNFLELDSKLSKKNIFVTNFPFLTDSSNPLNAQNPL